MIKIYHKTATIKAEQFDGSKEMIDKYSIKKNATFELSDEPEEFQLPDEPEEFVTVPYEIETLEGYLKIDQGDWIATGVNDEHWPIADEVFKKEYAELPVIPDYAADWIEECKQENISIGDMLCSERRPEKIRDWMALTPGTYQFDYARYQKYQELIARAWLDGYQVEADK